MNPNIKSRLLRTFLLAFSLIPSLLFSQEEYRRFDPYFTTGPIVTPSAQNDAAGEGFIQPYIFLENNFGKFNENRTPEKTESLLKLKESLIFGVGLFNWLGLVATFNAETNYQKGQSSTHIADTQAGLAFQLLREKKRSPALRLMVIENFPTGNYQKLKSGREEIETTGSGSYQTVVALNVGKRLAWMASHPIKLRASFKYKIPTSVHVQDFNAYGGGKGTKGRVRPGKGMEIDTSVELSLTRRLVLACDLVYSYQFRTTFSGELGKMHNGQAAKMGGPSKDSLSCAPGIEYNVSENLGFLLGSWFTITGRNSPRFVAGVLSMIYSW